MMIADLVIYVTLNEEMKCLLLFWFRYVPSYRSHLTPPHTECLMSKFLTKNVCFLSNFIHLLFIEVFLSLGEG